MRGILPKPKNILEKLSRWYTEHKVMPVSGFAAFGWFFYCVLNEVSREIPRDNVSTGYAFARMLGPAIASALVAWIFHDDLYPNYPLTDNEVLNYVLHSLGLDGKQGRSSVIAIEPGGTYVGTVLGKPASFFESRFFLRFGFAAGESPTTASGIA